MEYDVKLSKTRQAVYCVVIYVNVRYEYMH